MAVLYIVLPLAFLVAGAGILAFIWAARRGEFDDLDTPPLRAIQDDDPPAKPPTNRPPPSLR
jgi:cbb3-type cytochrome oxidase maturation protein